MSLASMLARIVFVAVVGTSIKLLVTSHAAPKVVTPDPAVVAVPSQPEKPLTPPVAKLPSLIPERKLSWYVTQPTPEEYFGAAAWKAMTPTRQQLYKNLYAEREFFGFIGFDLAAHQYENGNGMYMVYVPLDEIDMAFMQWQHSSIPDSEAVLKKLKQIPAFEKIYARQSKWRRDTSVYVPVDSRSPGLAAELLAQELDFKKNVLHSVLEVFTNEVL